MQKTTPSLMLSLFLLTQAAPAFAYQAHNWPSMAERDPALDVVAPGAHGGETPVTMPEGDDSLLLNATDPASVLTRAEFTKMLIDAIYPAEAFEKCLGKLVYKESPDYRLLFADTSIDHPAAKEICMAMRTGLVRGYADGNFRPDQPINFAEASKLLSRIFAFTPFPVNDPALPWYRPYVNALASRNIIPQTIAAFSSPLTAGDLKEMLYRIQFAITWRPTLSADELQKKTEKAWRAGR
jgi:hypothetical protein